MHQSPYEAWLTANSVQTLVSLRTIGQGRELEDLSPHRRVHVVTMFSDSVSDCVVISRARCLWPLPSRWKCQQLPGHHAHRPAQDSRSPSICVGSGCHMVWQLVLRILEFCLQGLWLRLWIILGNDIRSHHILGSQRHIVSTAYVSHGSTRFSEAQRLRCNALRESVRRHTTSRERRKRSTWLSTGFTTVTTVPVWDHTT